jgi:hypothetical protein
MEPRQPRLTQPYKRIPLNLNLVTWHDGPMRTNFCDKLARSINETFLSSDSFCDHRGMSSEDFERVDTRGQS